jgi:hypothetical protein
MNNQESWSFARAFDSDACSILDPTNETRDEVPAVCAKNWPLT